MTCTGTGILPVINVSICPTFGRNNRASLLTAKAFALLFATSGTENPFWRQRAITLCLPTIVESCRKVRESNKAPPLSPLLAASHISCCIPMSILGRKNIKHLIDMNVRGLLNYALKNDEEKHAVHDYLFVSLASLLKFLDQVPTVVMELHKDNIIPILLHLLSSLSAFSNDSNEAICILVLQSLSLVQKYFPKINEGAIGCRIISIIGNPNVIDHKCKLIRKVAAKVRNEWIVRKDSAISSHV